VFEKTLEFKNAIFLLWQVTIFVLQQILPKAQVWAITKTITSTLNHVVSACVMNQSKGH